MLGGVCVSCVVEKRQQPAAASREALFLVYVKSLPVGKIHKKAGESCACVCVVLAV